MAKYHITKRGEPGICRAQEGNCPLGGKEAHYESREVAQAAFEEGQKEGTLPPALKATGQDYSSLTQEELATHFDQEENFQEGDELVSKIYASGGERVDLTPLGEAESATAYTPRSSYEVATFTINHGGRTYHGVYHDDGYEGSLGEAFQRIKFAPSEEAASQLLQEEVETFRERIHSLGESSRPFFQE